MQVAPAVKYPYKNVRWAFMKWADIPDARDDSRVYLRRLRMFQTPLFAIYLHFIYLPDYDRDPHDHPANFWSFIVRGWYRETVYKNCDGLKIGFRMVHRRFSLHKMPVEWAHMITDIGSPLVTLVLFGNRQREWGFWSLDGDGFIPWREYERDTEPVHHPDCVKYGDDSQCVPCNR